MSAGVHSAPPRTCQRKLPAGEMIPSRHPAIYKETLSTLIALPLLHAQDCHAGLLHASAAAARQSPDGAPRVEV